MRFPTAVAGNGVGMSINAGPRPGPPGRWGFVRRWFAAATWSYLAWVLLTWTRTVEQLTVGAGVAILAGLAVAPLGAVAEPWGALEPRRLAAALRAGGFILVRLARANLSLGRRIWSPSRPLRPGMVTVRTAARSDGAFTAVGLFSSLIVDNQLVDVQRDQALLSYHAVWVDPGGADEERLRAVINGPLEDRLARVAPGGWEQP